MRGYINPERELKKLAKAKERFAKEKHRKGKEKIPSTKSTEYDISSGFIYMWRDKLTNRYYLGSHRGTICDGYIGSGVEFLKEYHERPQDFRRRILLEITLESREELFAIEEELLYMAYMKGKINAKYYNLTYGCLPKSSPLKASR